MIDGMAKAQREYDNPKFPEDFSCEQPCPDCDGMGCPTCKHTGIEEHHRWKRIPGEAKDGTTYCRCVRCGAIDES